MRRRYSDVLGSLVAFGLLIPSAVRSEEIPSPTGPQVSTSTESERRGEAYYHLMKARLAAARGRAGESSRELRDALALEPSSAGLHAEAAGLLAGLGRREEGERLARRALELDPSEPTALRTLADLLASRALGSSGDVTSRDEAIRLYDRLVETDDPDPAVLRILTNLKLLADDLGGAVETARKYAARRPADANAARLVMQILLQQGRAEEALQEVLAFLRANPDADDLIPAAAELASRTNRWADVERAAGAMRAARPDAIGSQVLLGESLLRQGREADAMPLLESALAAVAERREWQATVQALLGEAYLRQGRSVEAARHLEKAQELGESDPLVRLHLATAYSSMGRLADGSALAKALADDYPGNPAILVILGECLAQQGLVTGAVEAFAAAWDAIPGRSDEAAVRRDDLRLRAAVLQLSGRKPADAANILDSLERKDRAEALRVRVRSLILQGQRSEARSLTRKLGEKDSGGASDLLEAEILLREGRERKAEQRFAEAVARLGPESRERVATVYRDAGRPEGGERVLREWVRLDSGNARARFALGRFLERSGRFPEAEGELRQSLALDPGNDEAMNYLGYSLADRGEKLEEALELIRRSLEIEPWNGAYLDSLGWVYFRMGRYEQAREPLERAAREFPRDPTVLEHLGDLYDKLGETERAVRAWSRALEAGPDDEAALRRKIATRPEAVRKDLRDRTKLQIPPLWRYGAECLGVC